ncbi:hypothetical protein J830_4413, partial [Acinetobacter baumannii 25691_7]
SHEIIAVYTQPDRKAGRGQKIIQKLLLIKKCYKKIKNYSCKFC